MEGHRVLHTAAPGSVGPERGDPDARVPGVGRREGVGFPLARHLHTNAGGPARRVHDGPSRERHEHGPKPSRSYRSGEPAGGGLVRAGCAVRRRDPAETFHYDCGGYTFAVAFHGDTAAVELPTGQVLQLPLAISASGARYSDGRATYWEHQGTARLELPDTVFEGCRPVATRR